MSRDNYVYVRGRVIAEDQDGRKLVVIMENSRDPVARWLDADDYKKFIVSDGYITAGHEELTAELFEMMEGGEK